jgi:peptide/nickel transport system substrate-binding protein
VAGYLELGFDIFDNWSDPVASKYCAGVVPDFHNPYMDENMCGTGPFIFGEWIHQTRIVLNANPNYWGKNDAINDVTGDDDYWMSHAPKVDRVIRQQVDEFASRSLALLAGDCDHAEWPYTNAPEIYDISTHSVKPAYAGILHIVAEQPTLVVQAIEMNLNKTIGGVKPFGNLDFRLGFQYAFNYPVLIANVLNGHGMRLRSCVPAGMLGTDPTIPLYNYSATTAKAHFNTAMAALGSPILSIELGYNAGNEVRKQSCLMLKDEINSYAIPGLTLTVKEYDWPTFLTLIQTKQLPIFFVGWLPDYPDPDNYVFVYAHGSGTYAKRITYNNATITALVESAAVDTNVTHRLETYHEIMMELYREAMYMWIYQSTVFHVERSWVTGWYYNPMHSDQPFWAMSKP